MKKNLISYSFIILILLSFNIYTSFNEQYNNVNRRHSIGEGINLEASGFWSENDFSFIHIDNNWSAAEAAYDWIQWDSIFSKYVIENVSLDCTGNPFGILIENSKTWDFEIRNCTIYNAGSYGIRIDNTWSGIIDDCFLLNNNDGISIAGGSLAIVIQNCNIVDNTDGVSIEFSDFNTVRWSNITSNNRGFIAIFSDDLNILDNNISNNNGNGVQFARCDDCRVEGNILNENIGSSGGAVYWDGGSGNVITENHISGNREGIYFTYTSGSTGTSYIGITNNNVTDNNRNGISIMDYSFTDTVNIRNNNVSGNSQRGIQVFWARDTTIDDNYVDNNGDYGITIAVDHDTTVSDNFVRDNGGYGIYHPDESSPRENLVINNNTVSGNSDYNIFISSFDDHATYPGSFTSNTIIGNPAIDQRTSLYNPNSWNNNYFSYYSGEDANDDGIGDTPQTLYNPTITIQDQNPRWWDSPLITITSPSTDDYINATAPEMTYDVSRGTVDTVWYNLDDGVTQTQNYTYSSSIDQSAWDLMNDGYIWISLYVNGSNGWEGSDVIKVIKDSIGRPRISISGVNEGDLFGKSAPSGINILVTDPDGVDDTWYQLENSTYSSDNSTWLGYVEQNIWDLISNGTISIIFYANDTLGNTGSKQITVKKDIFPPNIQITDPSPMELVEVDAPTVSVIISDVHGVSERWYNLYNATYSTSNITWTGLIDSLVWEEMGNGTVTVRIWANDTVNNIAYDEVTLRKDVIAPFLSILTPLNGEIFNGTAPDFSLSVNDNNLDDIWYSLDNGVTNNSCSVTGTLDQLTWSGLPDGPVSIIFYANDSLGNIRSAQISIRKDTDSPVITIISPITNQYFPLEAPEFIIEVEEVNLDSLWYTINGGLTNISFTTNQTIDQSEWNDQSDGLITITFYANDTYGRINSSSISIFKDTTLPTITLLNPLVGELFGEVAPNFTVVVYDTNPDVMWYTLDGGLTNITFTINGTLDQSEWTAHPDGTVTLIFYAKDLAGNEFNSQIDINKDTSTPMITIIAPLVNEYLSGPPMYNITIVEPNLDSYWYTIDGGVTNITLSAFSGVLGSEWLAALDGPITIRFYANDSNSNENFADITIIKDATTPIMSIITPDYNEEYQVDPPGYIIDIIEVNLESCWYTLDGGITNITIDIPYNNTHTQITDSISYTAWDNAPEGTIIIHFYAKDLAGNIGTDSVTIIKNTAGNEPPPSPGIPGYDIYLFIIALSVISAILIRKRVKS